MELLPIEMLGEARSVSCVPSAAAAIQAMRADGRDYINDDPFEHNSRGIYLASS
jgi:hypothetical protein